MVITVLYFWRHSLCIPQICFATMGASRFTALSDEELQTLLEDRDSSKPYNNKNKTKTQTKHIHIRKQQKHLIY